MNQWSRTRKRIILLIVFLAIVVLVGVPLYLLFYQKPTCSDGKLNGDEAGVDCGGSCQRLCSAESLPLILQGEPRVLLVGESASTSRAYEVVAIVNNPNQNAEVYSGAYTIRIFDAASTTPVKIVNGSTFIPRGTTFAIFEGPFALPSAVVPSRATFEWKLDALSWRKNSAVLPEIEVAEVLLSKSTTTPRLDALVENLSLNPVSNLDLVALISDADGNLFAASKTFIDMLRPGEAAPIVFTWPRPFDKEVAEIEIIKRIFPDRTFIK